VKIISKWTIKEEINGDTWWIIRGGAFSNVINDKYPHRFFETKEEAEVYSGNLNRRINKKTKVVDVGSVYIKPYKEKDE
tara:strand:+ start:541 stop:777 length:237 start_codon:yes stop_codon:yes gene_type:complete